MINRKKQYVAIFMSITLVLNISSINGGLFGIIAFANQDVKYNPLELNYNDITYEVLGNTFVNKDKDPNYTDSATREERIAKIDQANKTGNGNGLSTNSRYNFRELGKYVSANSRHVKAGVFEEGASIPPFMGVYFFNKGLKPTRTVKATFDFDLSDFDALNQMEGLKLIAPYKGHTVQDSPWRTWERPELHISKDNYDEKSPLVSYSTEISGNGQNMFVGHDKKIDSKNSADFSNGSGIIGIDNRADFYNKHYVIDYDPNSKYFLEYRGTVHEENPKKEFKFEGSWDKIGVYLVDDKRPVVTKFSTDKTLYKKGDVAVVSVEFNEAIKFKDDSKKNEAGYFEGKKLKLNTIDRISGTTAVEEKKVIATFSELDENNPKVMKFKYKIPDNSDVYITGLDNMNNQKWSDDSVFRTITDLAGNEVERTIIRNNVGLEKRVFMDAKIPFVEDIDFKINDSKEYVNQSWRNPGDIVDIILTTSEMLSEDFDSTGVDIKLNNGVTLTKPDVRHNERKGNIKDHTTLTYRYEVGTDKKETFIKELEIEKIITNDAMVDRRNNTFDATLENTRVNGTLRIDTILPKLTTVEKKDTPQELKLTMKADENESGIGVEKYKVEITPALDLMYDVDGSGLSRVNPYEYGQDAKSTIFEIMGKKSDLEQTLTISSVKKISGKYTINITPKDVSGNIGEQLSETFMLDSQAPDITFENKGVEGGNSKIRVLVEDKDKEKQTKEGTRIKSIDYKIVDNKEKDPDKIDWKVLATNVNSHDEILNVPIEDKAENNKMIMIRVEDNSKNISEKSYHLLHDTREASYVWKPSNSTEIASDFDIIIAGGDSPKTTIEYGWLAGDRKDNPDVKYTSYSSTEEINIGKDTRLHGKHTLYARAVVQKKENGETVFKTYEIQPVTYKFNNESPKIKLSTTKDYSDTIISKLEEKVKVEVSDSYYTNDNEIYKISDESYFTLTNEEKSREPIAKGYLSGKNNFELDINKYFTQNGIYRLDVYVKGNNNLWVTREEIRFKVICTPPTYGKVTTELVFEDAKDKWFTSKEVKLNLTARIEDRRHDFYEYVDHYMSYTINGKGTEEWMEAPFNEMVHGVAVPVNLTLEDGKHEIKYKFKDSLGNETKVFSEIISVDTKSPTLELGYTETNPTKGEVGVVLNTLTDNLTPNDEILLSLDGGKWVPQSEFKLTLKENGSGTIDVKDKAENITSTKYKVDNIDKTPPTVKVKFKDGDYNYGLQNNVDNHLSLDIYVDDSMDTENYFGFDKEYFNKLNQSDEKEIFWNSLENQESGKYSVSYNKDKKCYTLKINYKYFEDLNEGYHERKIYIKSKDASGNETILNDENSKVLKFNILNSKPTIIQATPSKDGVGVDIKFNKNVRLTEADVTKDSFENYVTTIKVPLYNNKEYEVEFQDPYGNKYKETIKGDLLDKNTTLDIGFSPDGQTTENVTLTLDGSKVTDLYVYLPEQGLKAEDIKFEGEGTNYTLPNYGNVKLYKNIKVTASENKEIQYVAVNTKLGAVINRIASINTIDREGPSAEVEYIFTGFENNDGKTNANVIARLTNIKDNGGDNNVTTSDGVFEYEFTKNGSYTFQLKDRAGNITNIEAVVNSIDKSISSNKDVENPSYQLKFTSKKDGKATLIGEFNEDEYLSILEDKGMLDIPYTQGEISVYIAPEDESEVDVSLKTDEDGVAVLENNKVTFSRNGEIVLELKDKSGNKTLVDINIQALDNFKPEGEIIYQNIKEEKAIRAYIKTSDKGTGKVTITNSNSLKFDEGNGMYYYTFKENGEFVFNLEDGAGNKNNVVAKVDYIDLTKPVISLTGFTPNTIGYVNSSVTVFMKANESISKINMIKGDSDKVILSYLNDEITLTFKENESISLEVFDMSGNKSEFNYEIKNIDKNPPVISEEVKYKEEGATITFTSNEEVKMLNGTSSGNQNNGGTPPSMKVHVVNVRKNGEHTFNFTDEAGNMITRTVVIDGLDSDAPVITVTKSTESNVNKSIKLNIVVNEDSKLNINGKTYNVTANKVFEYDVLRNGTYSILAIDKSNNKTEKNIQVTNIDMEAPVIKIKGATELVVEEGITNLQDLLMDIEIKDNFDGDITDKVAVDTTLVDVKKGGLYKVKYISTDSVGNTSSTSRYVKVIPKNSITITVNNEYKFISGDVRTIAADSLTFKYDANNVPVKLLYKKGDNTLAEMKYGAKKLEGDTLKIQGYGLYTIVLQTQERQSEIIYIDVIKPTK